MRCLFCACAGRLRRNDAARVFLLVKQTHRVAAESQVTSDWLNPARLPLPDAGVCVPQDAPPSPPTPSRLARRPAVHPGARLAARPEGGRGGTGATVPRPRPRATSLACVRSLAAMRSQMLSPQASKHVNMLTPRLRIPDSGARRCLHDIKRRSSPTWGWRGCRDLHPSCPNDFGSPRLPFSQIRGEIGQSAPAMRPQRKFREPLQVGRTGASHRRVLTGTQHPKSQLHPSGSRHHAHHPPSLNNENMLALPAMLDASDLLALAMDRKRWLQFASTATPPANTSSTSAAQVLASGHDRRPPPCPCPTTGVATESYYFELRCVIHWVAQKLGSCKREQSKMPRARPPYNGPALFHEDGKPEVGEFQHALVHLTRALLQPLCSPAQSRLASKNHVQCDPND